ncbi:reactive intermediate/imine deaminase [Nitrospirillum viridazoti]|uniref:Reactive intermediate/imine deaminase n=2 Tax=Nitrospirillum TaxID=1543705 RepID=A0A560I0F8_9PROT|nr:reactive intermediate/imine deaminase [Nitrospirillum amazonense]
MVNLMEMKIETLEPEGLARPGGHYSHATRYGGLVFTAGQLGVRADGSHTADLGFEDQVRQALSNVLAVLRAAGAGPGDILKVTAYIVGVENWPRFNAVYAEMMGDARPARTVVPVGELHYGYLVEIDAVAVGGATGAREGAR